MRKANYDKFPSTKLTGVLVQGWDIIISMLKEKMDARKVLAVDLYTGVYEEEVLGAFSKEFSGRVMNVRDLMKPEQEIQTLTERFKIILMRINWLLLKSKLVKRRILL